MRTPPGLRAQGQISRLRITGISRRLVVAGALIPGIISGLSCWLLDASTDRTIGVVGTVLAVSTFVLSQWQTSGPRARRVVMIPKSRSPFSSTIYSGLSESLSSYAELTLTVEWPEQPVPDEVEWQLRHLRSPSAIRADALVLVPAADNENIWSELVRLTRAGVFIVVVDTKPTNAYFSSKGVPRPCFVGSNFAAGGELVAATLVGALQRNPEHRALLAVGPRWSFPGSERSKGITHHLALNSQTDRVEYVEIKNWSKEDAATAVTTRLLDVFGRLANDAKLFVFCGNDKILLGVERRLIQTLRREDRDRILLFGYDGVLGADNDLLVRSCYMAIATVDARPQVQGRAVAELLIDEHRGVLTGRTSRYIAPELILMEENRERA